MGRLGVVLGIMLSALLVMASHFAIVNQQRQKLRLQLEDAATIAANHNEISLDFRSAQNRGRIIVANWPVLWWENGMRVRSHVAGDFDNLVALKRDRVKADKSVSSEH